MRCPVGSKIRDKDCMPAETFGTETFTSHGVSHEGLSSETFGTETFTSDGVKVGVPAGVAEVADQPPD